MEADQPLRLCIVGLGGNAGVPGCGVGMLAPDRLNNTASTRKPMIQHLSPSLRSALYALRGGFLVRPLVIVLTLGAAGAIFSDVEERLPAIRALVPETLFPSQAILRSRRRF